MAKTDSAFSYQFIRNQLGRKNEKKKVFYKICFYERDLIKMTLTNDGKNELYRWNSTPDDNLLYDCPRSITWTGSPKNQLVEVVHLVQPYGELPLALQQEKRTDKTERLFDFFVKTNHGFCFLFSSSTLTEHSHRKNTSTQKRLAQYKKI